MRNGQCIHAAAAWYESDLAASTQAVDGEEHLVPRKVGTLTRDLFEVASTGVVHDVDYLIFHSRILCHAPPLWEENTLLEE